ncbi:MAG: endonuclease/exonuclease/phosphatase family protein [Mycobacteriales bacterium]
MPTPARLLLPSVAIALSAGLVVPATANAAVARPAMPSGMRVVAATTSSFTVEVNRTAHAKGYRLYASTVRSNLYARNLANALASRVSKAPRMTVSGLTQRSAIYYYRVVAINGHRRHFSATIGEAGLKPAAPSGLTASGSALTWNSGAATGYRIEQADNSAMTSQVKSYTVYGDTPAFTPYDVSQGGTYWFRVRSLNGSTASAATPAVSMQAKSAHESVSVMTYNILEATTDGHQESGNTVAPWSQRQPGVVRFIQQANPGVVAIQEGASWVKRVKGPRQVDALRSALGSNWSLAHTEVPPSQHYYHRTGDYILYRNDEFTAVGTGNHWSIGQNHWAAYQLLRSRATGAEFLMISAHLIVPRGHANDLVREQETQRLISQARSYAQAHGNVPIVYGGDYNSDQFGHSPNGPAVAMRSARIPDAYNVAAHRSGAKWNTANRYRTRPKADYAHMDEVFVSRGVGVTSWKQLLNLSHGRFVGVIPSDHNPVVASLRIPY